MNPNFSDYARTITHGMWSTTRQYVENVAAKVIPIELLLVKIETIGDRGEKVLERSAEVAQPTTVHVFTGQAWAVDGADAHLPAVYDFSIIEIVKDIPTEKTIHFGGIKGPSVNDRPTIVLFVKEKAAPEDGGYKGFEMAVLLQAIHSDAPLFLLYRSLARDREL
ncbi:hypothetical protein PILCRDRAFT_17435 [Piloderma croceum F 1598]|uniref:Uncharacterized protein n=1 Tax=Piloderma croceum (strain F 1598) TaxID=765440 RepID=A0A0C3AB88_PILCF|nr:hypothetical protein PILCRDRAFT_17435 [Piloderma croceum F 1598]